MELAPELEPYFVMGTTDDDRGLNLTMAVQPGTPLTVQMLASTPLLVTVLNSILAAVIVALLVLQVAGTTLLALVLGVLAFLVTMGAFAWYAARDISRVIAAHEPRFPGPEPAAPTEPAP
jgi:hypothetical protein